MINRCPKCKTIQRINQITNKMIKCPICGYVTHTDDTILECHYDDFIIENSVLLDYNGTSEEVLIPSDVKYINKKDLFISKNVKCLYFSENIVSICEGAFSNIESLEMVFFMQTKYIESLPNDLFMNCKNLKKVILSQSIKYIGKQAFKNCVSLSNINITDSIECIGKAAFENCQRLKRIIIPSSVRTLEESTFASSGIEEVIIPFDSKLEEIKTEAFFGLNELVSFEVPKKVISIDKDAFKDSDNVVFAIDKLQLENLNDYFSNNNYYLKDEKKKVNFFKTKLFKFLTSVVIFTLIDLFTILFLKDILLHFGYNLVIVISYIISLLDIAVYVYYFFKKDFPKSWFIFGAIPLYISMIYLCIIFE